MADRAQIAVLASGNGTNLQAILDRAAKNNGYPAQVRVVISDKKKARALERAEKIGVEAVHVSPKSYASREAFDLALVQLLNEREVEWVVLAGFMRILTPVFVRPFFGRIINIHPALLPKYPGIRSIERAFKDREKEVGVTVHFVDEGVDTGPIIKQEATKVKEGESLDQLTERVHEIEHRIFPEAIRDVIEGRVPIPERSS